MKRTTKLQLIKKRALCLMLLSSVSAQASFLDYFSSFDFWENSTQKEESAEQVFIGPIVRPRQRPTTMTNLASSAGACGLDETEQELTGIGGIISFFGERYCSEGALMEYPEGEVGTVETCQMLKNARDVCVSLDPVENEALMSFMSSTQEPKAQEVEHKLRALEVDLEGMKQNSLIQFNLASSYNVLTGISTALKNAFDARESSSHAEEKFQNLLKHYNMGNIFEQSGDSSAFSLDAIANNSFQCTPDKMQAPRNEASFFDAITNCEDPAQQELLDRAKELLQQKCESQQSECPFSAFIDGPGGIYEKFSQANIVPKLSASSADPLFSISDFGQARGFGDNQAVADALSFLNKNGPGGEELKDFRSIIMDEYRAHANKPREEAVSQLRQFGARNALDRYIIQKVQSSPKEALKERMLQHITSKFLSNDSSTSRFDSFEEYMRGSTLTNLQNNLAVEGEELLNSDEIMEMSQFVLVLGTGANFAEVAYDQVQVVDGIGRLFPAAVSQAKPITEMLAKLDQFDELNEVQKTEFLRSFQLLRDQSPMIDLLAESNDSGGSDPFKALKGVLSQLQSGETSGNSSFGGTMAKAEIDLAEKVIAHCNEGISKRRRERLFCTPSSLSSSAVADRALERLFDNAPVSEGEGRAKLSQALLLCGPILQQAMDDAIPEGVSSRERSRLRNNNCHDLAQSLYDYDGASDFGEDSLVMIFGSTCPSSDRGVISPTSGDSSNPQAESCDPNISANFTPGRNALSHENMNAFCNLSNSATSVVGEIMNDDGIVSRSVRDSVPAGNPRSSNPFSRSRSREIREANQNLMIPGSSAARDSLASVSAPVRGGLSGGGPRGRLEAMTDGEEFVGMNASDYQANNRAMASSQVSSSSSQDGYDSLSGEFAGKEEMLGQESSELLARLRAKEEELDGKMKFYDDLLASNKDGGAESSATKALEKELAELRADAEELKRQLNEKRDARQALASAVPTPTPGRSLFAPNTRGSSNTQRAPASAAPYTPLPTQAASAPTSRGPASVQSYSSADFAGTTGEQSSSFGEGSVLGGGNFSLTSGSVLTLTRELRDRIVDSGMLLNEAILKAKGPVLMPSETEGVYTLFEPIIGKDGEVVTLDGEVQFKKIVRVTEDGKPLSGARRSIASEIEVIEQQSVPERAPTRLREFNIINDIVGGEGQ